MKNSRWLYQVFLTEMRKIVAYRFDFWIQFLVSIFAHITAAYFLWKAVFEYNNTDIMKGYTFRGLMFYYLLVPLIEKIINGSSMGLVSREIYDGSLTRYLIYPVSFFRYKYVQHLAGTVIFFIQLGLTVSVFLMLFGKPVDVTISIKNVSMGITAVMCSGIMTFFINTSIEMIAFWADNVWTLLVMVRFSVALLGGAMIPLAFFPGDFQQLLSYLPFSYMASFPIRSFLGKVTVWQWISGIAVTCLWAAFFILVMFFIWNRGKYKYTGVGI